MPAGHASVYSKDEELGKRDDDFRPRQTSMSANLAMPWRWRKRRVLAALALMVLVYLFIKNIPKDLEPANVRLGMPLRPGQTGSSATKVEPSGAPPRPARGGEEDNKQYYNGNVKYYRLSDSLFGIIRTGGARSSNRNVLFAVSSLKSAANIVPMACEMARRDNNYVHFALLGRDSLPLDEILSVNGISMEDCGVFFHDARVDYSDYSTDERAEYAVAVGMRHINEYMHPQAIIMDDSAVEDTFFTRAMRYKCEEYGRALIEVPEGRYEEFLWMTRLDAKSLGNWFRPSIDILIQAPPSSSGSLIRLLTSLENAQYAGLKIPGLTIELPTDIDPFTTNYLRDLEWPPVVDLSPIKAKRLTLHHRIPSSRITSDEASLRFLESFYPVQTEHDHVLILSPQTELSPLYLQYLHFTILEYRYSFRASQSSENLLGLSLDTPSTYLNGTNNFALPLVADMRSHKYLDAEKYDQDSIPSFLYQAPSATASLIFGDKWVTLQNFLTNRLVVNHAGKAEKRVKLVSESEPSWLEYLLELMRARGWNMLCPHSSFVTLHNELVQVPEEFVRKKASITPDDIQKHAVSHLEEEAFLTAPEPPKTAPHVEHQPLAAQPLLELLPFGGDLPDLSHLPLLSPAGGLIDATAAGELQNDYVSNFRKQIGGCDGKDATQKRRVRELRTDDLFCLPGLDVDFEEPLD